MFLVEDVREASPSQLKERRQHIERRAKWDALGATKAPVIEATAAKPNGWDLLLVNSHAMAEIVPPLPMHIPGNARSIVKIACKVAATHFGIETIEIIKRKRTKQIVLARHVAAWLLKCVMKWSYPEIGRRLGGKDHTTVMHGIKKMERRLSTQPEFASTLESLKAIVLDRMHHTTPAVPSQREQSVPE